MNENELASMLEANKEGGRSRSSLRKEVIGSMVKSNSPRPTGDGAMLFGWIAIVAGILCGFFGVSTYDPLNWLLFGAGLANLGLISLVAGYIVRAISFLPGRNDNNAPHQ